MSSQMGPAQAGILADKIDDIYNEVRHWQAAHPGAQDLMVDSLEYFLRRAQEGARIMHETRRNRVSEEEEGE